MTKMQQQPALMSGWGKFPVISTNTYHPQTVVEAQEVLASTSSLSCMGNGRGYGDCALNAQAVLVSNHFNLFHSFDEDSALLVAGAGLTLAQVLDCFIPRGFFLGVTPGTKFVSLGGAVAADVHGKDHHQSGTFSSCLEFIELLTAQEGLVRCSRKERPELFFATIGGMGLTGLIVTVALYLKRIPSAYVEQHTFCCGDLKEVMDCFAEQQSTTYSVAWIDCLQSSQRKLGRSLLMAGDFMADELLPDELRTSQHQGRLAYQSPHKLTVPFEFPSFTLNSLSVKAFNALYFHKTLGRKLSTQMVSADSFFYPLDAILRWNRIYGARGFTQYQFVLPPESSYEGVSSILKAIAASGKGSFLTVLKQFGSKNNYPRDSIPDNKSELFRAEGGFLSFPKAGFTLALDFAIEPSLFALLERLDDMVRDYGGRIYLAKDSRLNHRNFKAMYGSGVDTFLKVKAQYDPSNHFTSMQAQRLGLVV